jgi:hypothetical protein
MIELLTLSPIAVSPPRIADTDIPSVRKAPDAE